MVNTGMGLCVLPQEADRLNHAQGSLWAPRTPTSEALDIFRWHQGRHLLGRRERIRVDSRYGLRSVVSLNWSVHWLARCRIDM